MDNSREPASSGSALALGLLGVSALLGVALALVISTPEAAPAVPHSVHGTLATRPRSVGAGGWIGAASLLIGMLMILTLGLLAQMGLARRHTSAGRSGLWIATGAYLVVFCALMVSYRNYAGSAVPELRLGFPAPTLWLLLGIWQLPWVLALLLVRNFDRWTLDPADLVRFEAEVLDLRAQSDR